MQAPPLGAAWLGLECDWIVTVFVGRVPLRAMWVLVAGLGLLSQLLLVCSVRARWPVWRYGP